MSDISQSIIPSWINGHPSSVVEVSNRGLSYGDGLFETIRVKAGKPVLLHEHLQRLYLGMRRLSIVMEHEALEQEILNYPGFDRDGIVKIIITRGNGARGYSSHHCQAPTRILSYHEALSYPKGHAIDGVRAYPCMTRLSINFQLAGIKHLNRLEQVLARQEWADDFEEGLVRSHNGDIVEGVFSNFFMVIDGVVTTPQMDRCGVQGVMRDWLIEKMREQGVIITEGRVTLDRLMLAQECFFCNSVYGVWPIREYQNRKWGVGSFTRQAQEWVAERWSL